MPQNLCAKVKMHSCRPCNSEHFTDGASERQHEAAGEETRRTVSQRKDQLLSHVPKRHWPTVGLTWRKVIWDTSGLPG